jgi:hypothetical protein
MKVLLAFCLGRSASVSVQQKSTRLSMPPLEVYTRSRPGEFENHYSRKRRTIDRVWIAPDDSHESLPFLKKSSTCKARCSKCQSDDALPDSRLVISLSLTVTYAKFTFHQRASAFFERGC